MTILQNSMPSAIAWLLAFAFAGAALFNAMGGAAVQAQFLRWGYPAWWNFIDRRARNAERRAHRSSRNANLGIGARGNGVDRRDRHPHMAPGIPAFAPGRGAGRANRRRIGARRRALRSAASRVFINSAFAGNGRGYRLHHYRIFKGRAEMQGAQSRAGPLRSRGRRPPLDRRFRLRPPGGVYQVCRHACRV